MQTQNEPDIVWLIKFAARRYYDVGTKMGQKLHMLLKEQLAYYLYLAPELIARGWEKEEFYQNVRDYTISVWGKMNNPPITKHSGTGLMGRTMTCTASRKCSAG